MAGAAIGAAACKEEPPPKPTRTGEPEVVEATFKLRLEKAIGLDSIILTMGGKVVGQASEPQEYMDVTIPAGTLLSEKKGLISLRVDTTCGEADEIPLEPVGLDKEEELQARQSSQKKFVEMKVSAAHPRLHFYVDNPSGKKAAVQVGKIEISVPPRGKASRMLFLADCPEAQTVTTPAGEGKLEGSDPAAYLVDASGRGCYRAKELVYSPDGVKPPNSDLPVGPGVVHRLPGPELDFFLEPAPETLSKEVIVRKGRAVGGKHILIRRALDRAPCR